MPGLLKLFVTDLLLLLVPSLNVQATLSHDCREVLPRRAVKVTESVVRQGELLHAAVTVMFVGTVQVLVGGGGGGSVPLVTVTVVLFCSVDPEEFDTVRVTVYDPALPYE